MANSYGPKGIVTDGLVFAADAGNKQCFTSGESTCKDLIQGSTGTLEGNTTFSSEAGGSWEFDGTSDDITWGTTVPIVEDFDTTSTFTFMQWHNQDATGEYHGLMTRSGTSYKGISQSVDNDNKFYVQLINALSSRIKVYSSSTTFTNNQWYHTCFTWDGNASGTKWQGVKIYINGQPQTVAMTLNSLSTNTIKDASCELMLGDRMNAGLDLDGKSTLGLIYNRELTASEVLQNYNAQKSRFGL